MGNRTNYGTGRMTVDNRQKNERSRSGNPYSSHVKAGKHAGTVYNFKRKSRIRKSLTRLPILLEFIHKYIFLNFVSFYNGLNSNWFYEYCTFVWYFFMTYFFFFLLFSFSSSTFSFSSSLFARAAFSFNLVLQLFLPSGFSRGPRTPVTFVI